MAERRTCDFRLDPIYCTSNSSGRSSKQRATLTLVSSSNILSNHSSNSYHSLHNISYKNIIHFWNLRKRSEKLYGHRGVYCKTCICHETGFRVQDDISAEYNIIMSFTAHKYTTYLIAEIAAGFCEKPFSIFTVLRIISTSSCFMWDLAIRWKNESTETYHSDNHHDACLFQPSMIVWQSGMSSSICIMNYSRDIVTGVVSQQP